MSDPPPRNVMFRVDARLVHTTLMNAWVPRLGASHLIVMDDEAFSSVRRQTILEMSAMDACEVFFLPSEDTQSLKALLASKDNTIVLFSTLEAALHAVEGGLTIPVLNIGHVPEGAERRSYHPSVHLGADDLQVMARLEALGTKVEIRPLPSDDDDGDGDEKSSLPSIAKPNGAEIRDNSQPAPSPNSIGSIGMQMPANESLPEPGLSTARVEREIVVMNERGLHLRVAHLLAQLATSFRASIQIGFEDYVVNAKSLLGLVALGAHQGVALKLIAEGPDAETAADAIADFFRSRCRDEAEAEGAEASR